MQNHSMVNEKLFFLLWTKNHLKMEVVESKALKSELSQTIVLLTKKVYINVKIYKWNVFDWSEKWIAYCILMMIAWAFRLSFIY